MWTRNTATSIFTAIPNAAVPTEPAEHFLRAVSEENGAQSAPERRKCVVIGSMQELVKHRRTCINTKGRSPKRAALAGQETYPPLLTEECRSGARIPGEPDATLSTSIYSKGCKFGKSRTRRCVRMGAARKLVSYCSSVSWTRLLSCPAAEMESSDVPTFTTAGNCTSTR